jgi:hypothetical protein
MRNESVIEILGGIRAGLDKRFDPSLTSHHTFWMGDMNYRTTFDKRTPADLDKGDNQTSGKLQLDEDETEDEFKDSEYRYIYFTIYGISHPKIVIIIIDITK